MTKHRNDLTADRLRELLSYDAETGVFHRAKPRKEINVGDVAGCVDSRGYVYARVDGVMYLAHRLAWLYVHGVWPADQIDHINGIRADNRIANLREATSAQNHQNQTHGQGNASGRIGVTWCEPCKKWRALIRVDGVQVHLGVFANIADAIAARAKAKAEYHTFQPYDRGAK